MSVKTPLHCLCLTSAMLLISDCPDSYYQDTLVVEGLVRRLNMVDIVVSRASTTLVTRLPLWASVTVNSRLKNGIGLIISPDSRTSIRLTDLLT